MPVNEWQNWTNTQRRPVMAGPTPNGHPTGVPGLNEGGYGYTRTVQDNELAGTHMEALSRGDNRILQQARARGVRAGASRGGINSDLAAAGGEEAWLNAATPVAMQQAGAYGDAATQNLESLRQQRISAEGNAAQTESASIGAGASMYGADRDLEASRERNILDRDLTLSGRDFQAGESRADREFRSGESQADREYQTGRDERQQGYNRENMGNQYDYERRAEEDRAARESDQYMFRQLIDNPEEFDPQLLEDLQSFWGTFRSRRSLAKPAGGP